MEQDEHDIRHLISTWLAASAAGDTETVLTLMSEDVVFLTPGHPPMRGKAAFAESQKAMAEFRLEATSAVEEVRVLGDWAYCWTKLSVVATPKSGGEPAVRTGNTLSVLRKEEDGSWVICRDANMLTAQS